MKLKAVFICFFIMFCFSCINKKDDKLKKYEELFDRMVLTLFPNNNFKKDDQIYYLIYGKSCEQCISLNLTMLLDLPKKNEKFTPIILGESESLNLHNLYYSVISEEFPNSLFVSKYDLLMFQMDLTKPLLLHFRDGELFYMKNYSDYEINFAKDYILEHI